MKNIDIGKVLGIVGTLMGIGGTVLSTVSQQKTMDKTIKEEVAKAIQNQIKK